MGYSSMGARGPRELGSHGGLDGVVVQWSIGLGHYVGDQAVTKLMVVDRACGVSDGGGDI